MLFVVATPIGNPSDLSERARAVLAEADLIAAEDTRHTGKLLAAANIEKAAGAKMTSFHAHNEQAKLPRLIKLMQEGKQVALVTDAGTPLVSDPGYALVDACLDAGIRVVPVPGPGALLAAISVAGIAGQGFIFEGFLPARRTARKARLARLHEAMLRETQHEARPHIFYEAPHRVLACLQDMQETLGGERRASICRELTKTYEQVVRADLSTLAKMIDEEIPALGEFVIIVEGGGSRESDQASIDPDTTKLVKELLKDLPPSKAAGIAARVSGADRRQLYDLALRLATPKAK